MKAAPKADDSSPLRCIPGSYFNTSLTIYYNLGILIEPPIISFLVIYSNLILNLSANDLASSKEETFLKSIPVFSRIKSFIDIHLNLSLKLISLS